MKSTKNIPGGNMHPANADADAVLPPQTAVPIPSVFKPRVAAGVACGRALKKQQAGARAPCAPNFDRPGHLFSWQFVALVACCVGALALAICAKGLM